MIFFCTFAFQRVRKTYFNALYGKNDEITKETKTNETTESIYYYGLLQC